jgi:tetratricopeptide (TPR) repeat protein
MTRFNSLLCLSIILIAANFSTAKAVEMTDETQLRLARGFIEQGEYYRAVTELKRLAILFPHSPQIERAAYGEALANYLGEEFESASVIALNLARNTTVPGRSYSASYLQSLAYWKMEQHKMALGALSSIADGAKTPDRAEKLACTEAVYLMDAEYVDAAKAVLERHIKGNSDASSASAGLAALKRFDDMPQKSPTLAGTLSAILPGAGYAYVGRWGDAATSLILNGLFAAATWDLLRDDKYAAGYLVGTVGLSFYMGNIYGSANAAHRFNLQVRRGYRDDVVGVLSLQLIPPGF